MAPRWIALLLGCLAAEPALAQQATDAVTPEGKAAGIIDGLTEQAQAAAQILQDNGVLLAMQDFTTCRVVERPPVCLPYRNTEICGMGPPSSGALTVGQILGIVEGFDLAAMGADSPEAWTLISDASRLAPRLS